MAGTSLRNNGRNKLRKQWQEQIYETMAETSLRNNGRNKFRKQWQKQI